MAVAAAAAALFLLIFFLTFTPIHSQNTTVNEFIFEGFNDTDLRLFEASDVVPNRALMLTNMANNVIGRAFYPEPIQMFHNDDVSKPFSFSTHFVFSIVPPANGVKGGYGIAFVISPSTDFPGAKDEHYLGIFSSSITSEMSGQQNNVLAVEFDTVNGHNENYSDSTGNHVGINLNNISSLTTQAAAYFIDEWNEEDFQMEEEPAVQAWIEYDGVAEILNVTIAKRNIAKPSKPLLSHPIKSSYFQKYMYMGFSASTGRNKTSSHYILGWSFRSNGMAQELNKSQLPVAPPREATTPSPSSSYTPPILALIGLLSALVIGLCIWFIVVWRKRKLEDEVIEDWELDCPHRFSYKDLHKATKGFKESEMIGAGGFGSVYKGVMPVTRALVAVKKIASNSIQGMREFVAEIESLGRLRHKHLVNLQGWCKRKNELLIVYDYIPNGSLDSLLYNHRSTLILPWETRFRILKGVAAGLLYLHEEWEKVVIHRDVKSNNVLIDADMNPRLGDFGLARLHDHDKISYTTNFVGTIGYIAPETARNGKASASADVFSYGVLMLEVVCGRRPLDPDVPDSLMLVEWVIQCQQMGRILDAVDQRLSLLDIHVVEEIEFVLKLGLICSHQRAEARPSMRQVVRYLNGDEELPNVEDFGSVSSHSSGRFVMSRFLEGISSTSHSIESVNRTKGSYGSLSIGGISTSSMRNDR